VGRRGRASEGQRSEIEWTDPSDWRPPRGCTRVSEGCQHCYQETNPARFSDPGQPFHGFANQTRHGPRWTGKVVLIEGRLRVPLNGTPFFMKQLRGPNPLPPIPADLLVREFPRK
jgi:protein gp37